MLIEEHHEFSTSTGAPGPHDFADTSMLFVRMMGITLQRRHVHRSPHSTYRDDRAYAPFRWGGMGEMIVVICPTWQAGHLRQNGTTGNLRRAGMRGYAQSASTMCPVVPVRRAIARRERRDP